MFAAISEDQFNAIKETRMAMQAHANCMAAVTQSRGGMHWKKISGREYLYRTVDGSGKASSLGVRSRETEKIHSDFLANKAALARQVTATEERTTLQSRFNRALKVGRLPNDVFKLSLDLADSGGVPNNLLHIELICLHAYEVLLGVHFGKPVFDATGGALCVDALRLLTQSARSKLLVISKSGKFTEVQVPSVDAFIAYRRACKIDADRQPKEIAGDVLVIDALVQAQKRLEGIKSQVGH